jgi:hypothetical protein
MRLKHLPHSLAAHVLRSKCPAEFETQTAATTGVEKATTASHDEQMQAPAESTRCNAVKTERLHPAPLDELMPHDPDRSCYEGSR